jgi:Contractile injection system tube protein
VRLAWGTFQFDGHVEALEETLEAFSADGRPLRATLALSLARAQIAPYAFAAPAGAGSRG